LTGEEPHGLASALERNISALASLRRREKEKAAGQERVAALISRFAGSMGFVYIHLVIVAVWVAINLGWVAGVVRFDPTFVILATAASVEAIFISTFVLISQNRAAAEADRRADLDLQVSLLAEHEITRLITLTSAIARHLDVAEAGDPELSELEQDIAPEAVMERMEQDKDEER
jgi:uncharacterized membrane protein